MAGAIKGFLPGFTEGDPLLAAWDRAQDAGAYQFSSNVEQITTPTASVLNAGRSSKVERFYLEGDADVANGAMEFRLWSDGGSVLQEGDSLGVRIADGKTFTQKNGGEWQEGDDFTQTIAPAGDFMNFLAAAENVTDLGQETIAGVTFTRYAFDIDGPTFAKLIRNQTEEAMRQKGELPPGVNFELSAYYADMIGRGELWVDTDGLPLRQMLELRFPAENNQSVGANIKVDYSDFGPATTLAAGAGAATLDKLTLGTLSLDTLSTSAAKQLPAMASLLTILLSIVLCVMVIYYRRAKLLIRALSAAFITTLLVTPVLSNLRLVSFVDKQTARAAEQQAVQNERAQLSEVAAEMRSSTFDAHQDKLALAPQTSVVASQLRTAALAPAPMFAVGAEEGCMIGQERDTDCDGLTDYIEVRIGTSEIYSDTDGDLILDLMEVEGFELGGKRWFIDPTEPDSNFDGIADTLEWDVSPVHPHDTDNDDIPDIFDEDNDDDGVPDRLDLAPFSHVGRTNAFAKDNPLQLTVNNLTLDTPTFVDFQIRPSNENQLWFALNRMDRPDDLQGQIRDMDGAPEDLRLVPMLEK